MHTLTTTRNGLADAVRKHAPAFDVADAAPSTLAEVCGHYATTGRVLVWSGASDRSIFDAATNYAFRAWHDLAHVRTGLGFDVASEIQLAAFQAAEAGSSALAALVLIEVAGQAEHYGATGQYVADQVTFALEHLRRNR